MAGRILAVLLWLTLGAAAGEIVVRVEGVRNGTGVVRASLFTMAAGFPSDSTKAVAQAEGKAKKGVVILRFKDVEVKEAAIAVLHDENNDGVLQKNLVGVPREGVAASKWDGKGKPAFAKAVTKFEKGKVLVVRVRYYGGG